MSVKNTLVYQVAKGQSLATSFTSAPTIVRNMDNCSYQINITTSNSVGTFAVEVSNDYSLNVANDNAPVNAGHWVALTLAGGTPFVSAANDNIVINLNQLPFFAVRLRYTSSTAGTGTADIFLTNKRLGG